MEEDNEETLENRYSKVPKQLRKYVFKVGNRGGGRPVGAKSLKTYTREYLESMTEEERVEYLNNLNPDFVWKMAEGLPDSKVDTTPQVQVVLIDKELAPLYGIRTTSETDGSSQEPNKVQGS